MDYTWSFRLVTLNLHFSPTPPPSLLLSLLFPILPLLSPSSTPQKLTKSPPPLFFSPQNSRRRKHLHLLTPPSQSSDWKSRKHRNRPIHPRLPRSRPSRHHRPTQIPRRRRGAAMARKGDSRRRDAGSGASRSSSWGF